MALMAQDHARQLRRIADEILSVTDAGAALSPAGIISKILLWGGLIPVGFGLYHLYEGHTEWAVLLFAIEVILVLLHAIAMHYERRTHTNHEGRIHRLRDELYEKEEDLIGTAEANNIRIHSWFRRYRHW